MNLLLISHAVIVREFIVNTSYNYGEIFIINIIILILLRQEKKKKYIYIYIYIYILKKL